MTRILITGAGGFVGRHAAAAFARSLGPGEHLAGFGLRAEPDLPEGMTYRAVDLLDRDGVRAAIGRFRPSHVLHLAGQSSVRQAGDAPSETWRTNLVGLLNLAEAVTVEAPGAHVLFVSSGEVYGRAFLSGAALTENAHPEPTSTYARSKLAGERMLADVLPAAGIGLIIARPFNHIGPGQDDRFVAASFAGQIARIEAGLSPPVIEVGDLTVRRDFLDVGDVVAAYLALLRNADRIGSGTIFNIASGRARPISDILEMLRRLARVPFEVRVADDRLRPSEIPVASGDAGALTRELGWTAATRIEDALAAMLDDARIRLRAASRPTFIRPPATEFAMPRVGRQIGRGGAVSGGGR